MKSLLITLIFTLLFAVTAIAQAGGTGGNDDNTIHISATYMRRNIDIRNLQGEQRSFDRLRDSAGFEFGYMHFLGGDNKTGRNGWFGVGVEGGASFHSVGESRVAFGYGRGAVQLQPRNSAFQPFVKGHIGLAGQDWGAPISVCSNQGAVGFCGRERSLAYGGAAGIDWRVGKKVLLRLPEVDYFRTSFGPGRQHNVMVKAGLVFQF